MPGSHCTSEVQLLSLHGIYSIHAVNLIAINPHVEFLLE